jgi:hypothetical protein
MGPKYTTGDSEAIGNDRTMAAEDLDISTMDELAEVLGDFDAEEDSDDEEDDDDRAGVL